MPRHYSVRRKKCPDCKKMFGNAGAMGKHWKTQHYVPPAPPKPPEERKFVSYSHFAKSQWGRDMTEYEKGHPSRDDIETGIFQEILNTLRRIETSMNRSRTIS